MVVISSGKPIDIQDIEEENKENLNAINMLKKMRQKHQTLLNHMHDKDKENTSTKVSRNLKQKS